MCNCHSLTRGRRHKAVLRCLIGIDADFGCVHGGPAGRHSPDSISDAQHTLPIANSRVDRRASKMTIYDKKRMVAGFMVILVVAAAANWHFEFFFPRFAQLIKSAIVVIGVCLYPFRPTRKDFEEHRRKRVNG